MGKRADPELLAILRDLAEYSPSTGLFAWREKLNYRGRPFKRSGRRMGCIDQMGYVVLSVGDRKLRGHTAAWLLTFECLPEGEIDHINGNRADNRIANLRDVPRFINCQNRRKASSTSRTGLLGSHWSAVAQKYTAQITRKGIKRHLGLFATAEEAHAAYVAAKRKIHEGCEI